MKKTETTTLLTYYIKCWIITRMISGMIDMKDNCRSWGPFPALSVYLICLNDSFLQRLGIQNIFAHNQPQINVQYLCILMLFMSFVLWEQKVFFFLHFLRSHYIYIYTHNSGISCGKCFILPMKSDYDSMSPSPATWVDELTGLSLRASPALTSPRRPGNDWCMIGMSLKEWALEIAVVLLAS